MYKEWYILINQVKEGPYTLMELKHDLRITPETLVWKEGFEKWIPIGKVRELREVFKDPDEQSNDEDDEDDEENEIAIGKAYDEQMALSLQKDPFHLFFWLMIAAIIFAYMIYQFKWTP